MSVVINGDTGISGVNGTAATPAIQGADTDTGIFFSSDNARISTGGVERLAVNHLGNVVIGPYNTSPFVKGLSLFPDNSGHATIVLNGDNTETMAFGVYDGNSTSYKLKLRHDGSCEFKEVEAQGGTGNGVQPLFRGTSDSGGTAQVFEVRNDGKILSGVSSVVAADAGPGEHAQLYVKSPGSITTDAAVLVAKFQGNTSQTSSQALISCSAGYDITANDTEGQVHFGAKREGNGNNASFIVKAGTSNISNDTPTFVIDSVGNIDMGGDQSGTSNVGQFTGGFGARNTTSVAAQKDFNASMNARSGNGRILMQGFESNGPGGTAYFHIFNYEYSSKNGEGNMTQFAIGYNSNLLYMRYRFSDAWSGWTQL